MAHPKKKPAPFPSREELVRFIHESPKRVGKREIARAFGLNADQKIELKKVLRELETDGTLQRGRGRRFAEPGSLPDVTVVQVSGIDMDGEIFAKPVSWDEDEAGPPPKIYMAPERRGQSALGIGDRVLAKLNRAAKGEYEGRTIRRLANAPATVLGIYRVAKAGRGEPAGDADGRIEPTHKKAKGEFLVHPGDANGAKSGDLVRAEIIPGKRLGLRRAKILERLANLDSPRAASLIAIHDHGLATEFPPDALDQARAAGAAPLGKRDDLRDIPLITIDGADARDFDDAVFAEADVDPKNPGGWHLIVAIADVSWYVRPGDALDRSAFQRGNSTYFPDRVLPMLPEELSNGWCSLRPKEDRPCLAAHLWIDAGGTLKRHKIVRGLMRSAARLTYDQVQAARDGKTDDDTDPLTNAVIAPLYGAYEALLQNRAARGVLELDLPERRVMVDDLGQVENIVRRERFDSHKLIEEFMILANVAAAETLERISQPCMYRIHDQPSPEKITALAEFLASLDLKFAKGQVIKPAQFNQILKKASDTPHAHMINEVVLRSQSQAEYNPENIGHFGLALRRYCHFTSPIRRYSDLLVHRALVRGLKLGEGALETDHRDFTEMGQHISSTERQSAAAERDAVDRFIAGFLADQVGSVFAGRINGVTRFGLFITLEETGADGLVPISSLPDDYYRHDETHHCLRGDDTGRTYSLGEQVEVLLMEASPVTGGMMFQLLAGGSAGKTGKKAHKRGGSKRRGGDRSGRGRLRGKTSQKTSRPRNKKR